MKEKTKQNPTQLPKDGVSVANHSWTLGGRGFVHSGSRTHEEVLQIVWLHEEIRPVELNVFKGGPCMMKPNFF